MKVQPKVAGTRSVRDSLRAGVTLVELLVVIFIMLAITAIAIPVIAPSMKNRDIREAARMLDVFINGARTRAMQAGHSYGIMIERMPGQPNGSVTVSYCEQPDPYAGDYATSGIRLLDNGGFGAWAGPGAVSPSTVDPVLPMGDLGWIESIAPGDIMTIKGTAFRIWAGEPFIDIDQNGVRNQTDGSLPGTPVGVWEPFADVDGDGNWTPPGLSGTIDTNTGYFNFSAFGNQIPPISYGSASAYITYMFADPVLAAQYMSGTGKTYYGPGNVNNGQPLFFGQQKSITKYSGGMTPMPIPNAAASFSFSIARRPVKTSAPSLELPGGAVIDLGANLAYTPPGQPTGNIIPVPGSGIEVLASNANQLGLWATFGSNPRLDPALNGLIAGVPAVNQPVSDPTPVIITFLPSGTVDKVYSWSEINDTAGGGTVLNWTDWQGRIPAGPIYLLIGRQELVDGDPTLLPLIAQNLPPIKPVYNLQDPNALWTVINPLTGAVATAENVGYDLSVAPVSVGTPTYNSMFVYWNANVYYGRRLARSMLDMGGR